ncbi:MAG: response regulator [Prochloraceae cyanobacterium]
MTRKAELNIYLDAQLLSQFKDLCDQKNLSLTQGISNYMRACVSTQQLIQEKDLNQTPIDPAKIIDESKTAIVEKQKTPKTASVKTEIEKDIERLIDQRIKASLNQPTNTATSKVIAEKAPTVLIVENSITVRELVSLSFSKGGYRVKKASDGQQAWELLKSGLACDLILCDIEMPVMDGLELLSRITKDKELSKIPVAMLTFMSEEKYQQQAAKLGASGYFIKPYKEKELLAAAQRMLNGEKLMASAAKALPEKPVAARKIAPSYQKSVSPKIHCRPRVLIVDDSIVIREMVSMSFSKTGYKVEQARDGQEAWELLRSGLPCDLIICDIEMPRMNGLEFLSRVQEHPELASIPVAMLTSRGSQKMKQIATQRGAKAYFVKPYIEKILMDAAQKLLNGEVLLKETSNQLSII